MSYCDHQIERWKYPFYGNPYVDEKNWGEWRIKEFGTIQKVFYRIIKIFKGQLLEIHGKIKAKQGKNYFKIIQ